MNEDDFGVSVYHWKPENSNTWYKVERAEHQPSFRFMEYAARGEFCAAFYHPSLHRWENLTQQSPGTATQETTYPAPLLGELHLGRGFEASLLGTGIALPAALSPWRLCLLTTTPLKFTVKRCRFPAVSLSQISNVLCFLGSFLVLFPHTQPFHHLLLIPAAEGSVATTQQLGWCPDHLGTCAVFLTSRTAMQEGWSRACLAVWLHAIHHLECACPPSVKCALSDGNDWADVWEGEFPNPEVNFYHMGNLMVRNSTLSTWHTAWLSAQWTFFMCPWIGFCLFVWIF